MNDGPPLVAGLRISEIALYQGPKSTVMKGGELVPRDVPVVVGRDALLRIFLAVDRNVWTAHDVKVRVDRTAMGAPLPPLEKLMRVSATSSETDVSTTATFEIPGDEITADLTYSVSLLDTQTPKQGDTSGARFPAEGEAALDAADSGESLQVVLIPVRYDFDGSGRLPDVSNVQVERLRVQMHALYPVRRVDITVGAEFPWGKQITAQGAGWGDLLEAIVRKRLTDGVPTNVYYYGVFEPAESIGDYCGNGCILGLSPTSPDPDDDYARGSIGLGYSGSFFGGGAASTFVHEVGHAHGRQHAPCQLGNQPDDPDYPYAGGRLGTWGWDVTTKALRDPAGKHRDMMGYCSPIFVSDYTYKALFERVSYLNAPKRLLAAGEAPRYSVLVDDGKTTSARDPITLRRPAGGEARGVARFYPFDHLPGGIWLVPNQR